MKHRIYLDDVRTPVSKESWVVVRNYNEFVAMIQFIGLENIDIISLDHDLGESSMVEYYNNVKKNYQLDYNNIEEKTGYDCAKWLVQQSILTDTPIPIIYTHSANPIGSANIMGYVNNYLMNCKLPQTCVRVEIEHIIEEEFILSPEERQAKWQKAE